MSDTLERLREDVKTSELPMHDIVGNYLLDEDCDIIDAAFRLAAVAPALLDIAEANETIRHLVEYEWRLKHHNPALVLNTIADILASTPALDSTGGAER